MATHTTSVWTPSELHHHLDKQDVFSILDLRNRNEFDAWKIEGRIPIHTLNIPYYDLLDLDDENEELAAAIARTAPERLKDWLPQNGPILAVCARGDTSAHVAEGLRRLDYPAFSLEGGMAAWGNHYEVRSIEETPRLTILQISRPARGCLGYLLAGGGNALAIDVARHIDVYTRVTAERGWRIAGVIDTHLQADHLSGGPALARDVKTDYWLHPYDSIHPDDLLPATFSFRHLVDGMNFTLGDVGIRALHLPGHTLGMINLLVDGRFLLAGDNLFNDSVGRPDLGGRAGTWIPLLHRSLEKLLTLPDDTIVLPSHFGGVVDADDQGCFRASLGVLRTRNEGLRMLSRGASAFGAYILENLPDHPKSYDDIRRVNTGLLQVDETKAAELELGSNRCAISRAETPNQALPRAGEGATALPVEIPAHSMM